MDGENVVAAIQLSRRQTSSQQPAGLEKSAMKFVWHNWKALNEAGVIGDINDAFPNFIMQVVSKYK